MSDKPSGPKYFECVHQQQEPRLFTKSGGGTCVVMQCCHCGERIGQEFPKSKYDVTRLAAFDTGKRDAWQSRNQAIGDAFYTDINQKNKLKISEWWGRYNEYLHSDHWQRVRRDVLERDRTCQACYKYFSKEAHHLSYKTYNDCGFSFAAECVGVCHDCHQRLHGNDYIDVPIP